MVVLAGILLFPVRASALEVEVRGERLSIRAQDVPLREVLDRLAEDGLKVVAPPGIHPRITADFRDKPVHEGFGAILKPYGYVLFWERNRSGDGLQLSEIHLFAPGYRSPDGASAAEDGFALARNPRDGSLYVQNEILIQARPGVGGDLIERLVAGVGGILLEKSDSLGVYRARLPDGIDIPGFLEQLEKKEGRLVAEANHAHPILAPWRRSGAALPPEDGAFPPPEGEGGAPVAVMDSGLLPGYGLEGSVIASLDAVRPGMPVTDGLGHGTQMALIAAGMVQPMGAPGEPPATPPIIPIRTFDDNGMTSSFTILRGIDFALQNGARVLSMSWGSDTPSRFLAEAMDYADRRGLIVVASAGNEPTGRPVYPAAYPSVLGVGALAPDGSPWTQSNHGSFVSITAPGYAHLPVGYQGEAGLYAGTSVAAAYVSNVVAGLLTEHPDWSRADVMDYLKKKR